MTPCKTPTTSTPERLRQRAAVIQAMSHPSRLAMMEALAHGERCVCALREVVGADLSTVSKHLTVLHNAGIVARRKQGLQVFYRLRTPCLLRFFECVDAILASRQDDASRVLQEL